MLFFIQADFESEALILDEMINRPLSCVDGIKVHFEQKQMSRARISIFKSI